MGSKSISSSNSRFPAAQSEQFNALEERPIEGQNLQLAFTRSINLLDGIDGKATHTAAQIVLETASRLIGSVGCFIGQYDTDLSNIRCHASMGIGECANMHIARCFAAFAAAGHLNGRAVDLDTADVRIPVPDGPDEAGAGVMPAGRLLFATLPGSEKSRWILGFLRSGATATFHDHEAVLLRKMLPMFEWLLHQETTASAVQASAPCWQILNELHLGIVLVAADGHVAGANRVAASILKSGRSLILAKGRIAAKHTAENARFQKTLRKTRELSQSTGRTIVLDSDDGQGNLLIRFMRLSDAVKLGDLQSPCIAIFISDTSANGAPDPVPLQEMYDLTPLEAEIASRICAGLNPKETAIELGITANTVRSYLKSIFRKMGVHRQADLVRILAFSPL